ncbi:MAG: DUF4249 family protein [Candidatus Neomarinimicrobiota bacterium]
MKYIQSVFAGLLIALLAACSLPHEPGPQPSTIVETEFEPSLNILGILRLDDQPGSSFFYIERAYRYQELDTLEWDESFIPIVTDATVRVQGLGDTTSYLFTHELDSLRGEIYTNYDFFPVAGEQYHLTIEHRDFPTLTDTTVVPVKPAAHSGPVVMEQGVYFELLTTADTDLYDVYLLSSSDSLHYRFSNPGTGPLPLFFNTAAEPGDTLTVHIYGYDANLADYLTTTITLKPQTYQETLTTVTGGYGVFGAVSAAKFSLTR